MKEANGNPWWANSEPKNLSKDKPQKKPRNSVVIVGFMAIIAAMVGTIAIAPDFSSPKKSEFQSISYPGNTLSTIAKCGATFAFDVPQEFSGAVPKDFFIDKNSGVEVKRNVPVHPMIVPAYGYFYFEENPKPEKTFYSPKEAKKIPESVQTLNYLWNGWTIIWYKQNTEQEALDAVEVFVSENEKVMALPWTGDRSLPMNRNYAFSSWGNTRSCDYWDSSLVADFMEFSQNNSPERAIEKPYLAPINDKGELPRIDISQW